MDIISYALSKKGMQQSVSDYLDEHLTNPTNPPLDTSLEIAGAAADSKATGDKLSALKEDLNAYSENYDLGKKSIANTFQFGTLDTSGALVNFPGNARSSSVDYYTANDDDVLTLDAGFSIILCEYSAPGTLVSRSIKSSSTLTQKFALTSGHLYRLTIWDANASAQSTPYQYAYKAYLPTNAVQKNDGMFALRANQTDVLNANNFDANRVVACLTTNNLTNVPTTYGTLVNFSPLTANGANTSTANVQLWVNYLNGSALYMRSNTNGTWGSWKKFIDEEAVKDLINAKAFLPDVSMFETAAVIGDSFASGYMGVTGVTKYNQSWIQVMARNHGMTAKNYSRDGQTARGWVRAQTRGLSEMLSDSPYNLYVIALGLNDAFMYSQDNTYLGTVADMSETDYDQNPDTFYGNMGRIIKNIQTHAPKSKIVLSTTPYGTYGGNNGAVNREADRVINAAITEIAEHFSLPLVIALSNSLFYSSEYKNNILNNGSHPTATMYAATADAYADLIGNAMLTYATYFADYNTV